MATVRPRMVGFVGGPDGQAIWLDESMEVDERDPLVKVRPELFTELPKESRAPRRGQRQ